ncbi:hypothetical protein ACFE04_012466 [Oxalis oulophora]
MGDHNHQSPPISAPPSQFHSPSLTRSPLLASPSHDGIRSATPTVKTPRHGTPGIRTPRIFKTPLGSPIRKVLKLTRLDPQDAWLPITESRNGNAFYAAFHCLCSGIGIQALVLPVAFVYLGWVWGMIALVSTFIWQLYTLYILVQLHESVETGLRYSRYLQLCYATFGEKLSKWIAIFPITYLSGGTCTALIIVGGSTTKSLYSVLCGGACTSQPLTTVEWYLIFACGAVVLSQLPNLNSIAGVSLIGAITAVGYCTLLWAISVAKGTIPNVSYDPIRSHGGVDKTANIFNALGIVAFAFRGHNLILEIQGTMPSSEKHPSSVPMWKGVKVAYLMVATCLFPMAIAGFWAYGRMIPSGGLLTALFVYHGRDTSQFLLGLTCFFVIINALSSFQIYAMPTFDSMESMYTIRHKKACPWWVRVVFRSFFGFFCFFIAVAIPMIANIAGIVGGLSLPVTLAYPCYMWLKIKKPNKYSSVWWINWILFVVGMVLSLLFVLGALYTIIHDNTLKNNFFKPT